jgi:hypothetical protein
MGVVFIKGGINLSFGKNFEEPDLLKWEELVECLNDNADAVH